VRYRNQITSVIPRRQFLGGVSSTLVCGPAIVKAASLMRSRVVLPAGSVHFGYVTRMWLSTKLPKIKRYHDAGLSAGEIAPLIGDCMNGKPFDAEDVLRLVRLDDIIRRQDAFIRAQRPAPKETPFRTAAANVS
jgi:hypothetical protein